MSNYRDLNSTQKLTVEALNSEMDEVIRNKDEDQKNEFLNTYHITYLKNYGLAYHLNQIQTYTNIVASYANA